MHMPGWGGFLVTDGYSLSGYNERMTYQIALPPDQERKLVQQAHLRGLDAEDHLRRIVVSVLDGAAALTLETAPTAAAVEEWLDILINGDDALPILEASTLTREHLYADHD